MLQKTAIKEILTSNGGPVKTCDFHHNWPTNWPFGRTILFSPLWGGQLNTPLCWIYSWIGDPIERKTILGLFWPAGFDQQQAAAVTNQTWQWEHCQATMGVYYNISVPTRTKNHQKSSGRFFRHVCLLEGDVGVHKMYISMCIFLAKIGEQDAREWTCPRRRGVRHSIRFLPVRFRKVTWGWVSDEML